MRLAIGIILLLALSACTATLPRMDELDRHEKFMAETCRQAQEKCGESN